MRRATFALACALLAACSGDNAVTKPDQLPPAATTEPSPAAASGNTGTPVALTEDMARPYWPSGAAGRAFDAYQLEHWKEARDGFAAYLAGKGAPTDPTDVARARLVIATCDSHLSRWKEAAVGFEAAMARLPLIADTIRYQAARAHFFAHDMDTALALARKVAPDSIHGADAELLVGDILRTRKKHDGVAAHYQKYISDHPDGIRLAEAHYRLAEALEAAGGADEAAKNYRTITIRWPVSSWDKKAEDRLAAILPTLSEDQQKQLAQRNADELITYAQALYDANRNPRSAEAFETALEAPGMTPQQACTAAYYLADSWFKERDRAKSGPLFDRAMESCKTAGDIDHAVKSAYQAGRSYRITHDLPEAADRFAKAEAIAAKNDHSYADDARLRQAEAWDELGKDEKVTELLSAMPKLYPDGDMRAEAMWRLAWRAWTNGKYAEVVGWLKKQIATKPIEDKYYAEGQPQYWLGRAYAKLGKIDESIAAYEDCVRKYPLTYYSLLALNRLRESHPKRFAALTAEIAKQPADYDPKTPDFQFKPRALYGEPGFRRAIEFLRLGMGWAAESELARLGLTPPDGKHEVTDPDEREKLWAMAFLQDRAGRYQKSHWVTRWHVLGYKRTWPVGANRARWEIAYPKAYWDLVAKYAKLHGYPQPLQMAIVREESAFDPLQESWANAIGLTQMIFPTAKRFGKGTGIAITRENLRDPEKNVIIGSNFLSFLWDKWNGHTALVPPSYNAGEHAVERWLRARGDLNVDEWAESIEGDQARNYSKRVLASYFVYSYLYGGDIPVMRNDIPKELIPAARKRSRHRSRKPKGPTNYKD